MDADCLALLLAVGLAAVIALRYQPEAQVKAVVEALPAGVDLSLRDIDYTHVEGGAARWRLVAKEASRDSGAGLLTVTSPHLTFYGEDGAEQGTLAAKQGEVSNDYRLVRLSGQVAMEGVQGYSLYTEHLEYDHNTRLATTDAPVQMRGRGVELRGDGLVFDFERRHLTLLSGVNGTVRTTPQG